LASTSAGFLVSNSPVPSTSQLPKLATTFISPKTQRFQDLLAQKPHTELEANLQHALHWSNGYINNQKEWLLTMQAQNVLQHIYYTARVRGQLEHSEEKGAQKKKQCLHVDGRAKLLTQDEFFSQVESATTRRTQEEEELRKKKDARVTAHERLATALIRWEVEREACEKGNKKATEEWEASVRAWEHERGLARTERRKLGWTKPAKPTYTSGLLTKPPPKPKLSD
ncbi:hypothetical protein F5880DRAFT_1456314, partial [Lentinula raphanica]